MQSDFKIQKQFLSNFTLIILAFYFSFAVADSHAGRQDELISRLVLGNNQDVVSLLPELNKLSALELSSQISQFNDYPVIKVKDKLLEGSHFINDSLTAPYLTYIPPGYDASIPTPLVIWLHGGVSRPSFFSEDSGYTPVDYFEDLDIIHLCRAKGWLAVLPFARMDCLWWNKTGMDHINWLLRESKRNYNIDDDRVVLTGFSDGGSGSFHFALLNPNDYSILVPYSGQVSVGSFVGGMQIYPRNLQARPIFPVNGGNDGLYPGRKLIPLMRFLVEDADADLYYTLYDTAGHNHGYLKEEMPLFAKRLLENPRNSIPSKIFWECDNPEFGRIDWLEITQTDTALKREDWCDPINFKMSSDHIMIGFMSARDFEGEGVKVSSLSEDTTTVAYEMGMQALDIVTAIDDIPVKSMADLVTAKKTKQRGDPISITVLREGKTVVLSGTLPPVTQYDAFSYNTPSAAVSATRVGNNFYLKTSRVRDVSIFIHPGMIRLDQPVVVEVNGDILFEDLIKPDANLLLNEFLKHRDRKKLCIARIDIRL